MAGVAAVVLVRARVRRAGAALLPCDCGAVLIVRGCAMSTEDRRRLQTQNFTRVLHLEHLSLPTCCGCCVLAVNDEMVATIGVLAPVHLPHMLLSPSLLLDRPIISPATNITKAPTTPPAMAAPGLVTLKLFSSSIRAMYCVLYVSGRSNNPSSPAAPNSAIVKPLS